MLKLFDNTLLRFLLVGVVNTLVGCGTMFLLYNLLHCSYWVSSAANYVIGGSVSFLLNKVFTFRTKSWTWKEVGKFVVTVALCYLLAYGIAKPFSAWLLQAQPLAVKENIAMLVGMCLYTGLNYLGQYFFAFAKK